MSVQVTVIVIICFFLLIKPFRYLLNLFLNENESSLYKLAHLIGLTVLSIFLLVVMNDLTPEPTNLYQSDKASLFLVGPLLMILTLYVTCLFLYLKNVVHYIQKFKTLIIVAQILLATVSIVKMGSNSSLLFKRLGGGPESPGSIIYEMPWINPYTTGLVFNGYLLVFLTSITFFCAYMLNSKKSIK
ncbi:hypothetical protein SM124_04610 (plasmid) [Bacillus sp. 31A1R]|uniref:Uncharacterized protein n=1 Tax=Robertmurraya mangrovi TaxID=3098077 RepID=A0ABU5IV55_9BACI|nr:hypothetical protein [Bacillus sp. 31A1R]MDZ5471030.1 hypothetical protein [Bacillus sp. 31A1R]